jgi:tocopherol O-methyltransferase
LGPLYRQLWGEHLHHGFWKDESDRSSIAEATVRLLEIVTAPLNLRADHNVVDIGCGNGATARWIANRFGARVTGLTVSSHQVGAARSAPLPLQGAVAVDSGDWLANNYPDARFDAALAIESLAHMADKPAFFREVARTLKPGAPAAVACWIAAPDLTPLEFILLRSLCRIGCLPGIGTRREYAEFAATAGLSLTGNRDLTPHVEPTWPLLARRSLTALLRTPSLLCAALRQSLRRPVYVLAVPLMLLAYRLRALQYGVLWFEGPMEGS